MLPYGTQHLTDRELLLLGLERLDQVHEAVFGPPSVTTRLDVLETRIEERAMGAKSVAGLSALVSAVGLAIVEALRRANQ